MKGNGGDFRKAVPVPPPPHDREASCVNHSWDFLWVATADDAIDASLHQRSPLNGGDSRPVCMFVCHIILG